MGELSSSDPLAGHEPVQIAMMQENCMIVDVNDKVLRSGTKKHCHLLEHFHKAEPHRAFSVFIFDSDKRMLLQQRADEKVTFAGKLTNACCSHPLIDLGEDGGSALKEKVTGAISAGRRKLEQELGIPPSQLPPDLFNFLTRIHYKADSCETWCEHEIDYILFVQLPEGYDLKIDMNPHEVKSIKWVTQEQLKKDIAADPDGYTPWFRLMGQDLLWKWWTDLGTPEFDKHKGQETIERLLPYDFSTI